MSYPLNDFVLPPKKSEKLHPLGPRNHSSFSIARAFARSRRPSSRVQKPIFCMMKILFSKDLQSSRELD
ncbi:hypothetical protein CsSME_00034091 [Camellia sinensis var. sinensis]